MKITLRMLERETKTRNRACKDGIRWFKENFPKGYADHTQIIRKLNKERVYQCWELWLLSYFKLSGIARVHYSSGEIAIEERYKNGKKHGETKTFVAYGRLYSIKYYKDDRLIKTEVKI